MQTYSFYSVHLLLYRDPMLPKQGSLHPCRTATLLIQSRVTAHLPQKGQHTRRNDNTLVPPTTTTNIIRNQHTNFDSTLSRNESTPSRLNMKKIKSSHDHYEVSYLLTFYIYSRSTSNANTFPIYTLYHWILFLTPKPQNQSKKTTAKFSYIHYFTYIDH